MCHLFFQSLKSNSPKFNKEITKICFQPTERDIDKSLVVFLGKNGVNYCKKKLKNFQKYSEFRYFNVVNTLYYLSQRIEEEYILWMDYDVYFLREIGEIKNTDKIVVEINPIESKYGQIFNSIYEEFLKNYLPRKYKVESLEAYVNTWLMYGKTKNKFWKETYELSVLILKILQKRIPANKEKNQVLVAIANENPLLSFNIDNENFRNEYLDYIECLCEELSASILYTINKDSFLPLETIFGEGSFVNTIKGEEGYSSDSLKQQGLIAYHYQYFEDLVRCLKQQNFYKDNNYTLRKILAEGEIEKKKLFSIIQGKE